MKIGPETFSNLLKKERILPQTTNDPTYIGWEEKREYLRRFLIIKVEKILKGSLDSIQ